MPATAGRDHQAGGMTGQASPSLADLAVAPTPSTASGRFLSCRRETFDPGGSACRTARSEEEFSTFPGRMPPAAQELPHAGAFFAAGKGLKPVYRRDSVPQSQRAPAGVPRNEAQRQPGPLYWFIESNRFGLPTGQVIHLSWTVAAPLRNIPVWHSRARSSTSVSQFDKEGHRQEHCPNNHQQDCARHEIGKDHQHESAHQRHYSPLLLSIDEITEPCCA